MTVIVTALDGQAASCVNEAVVANGGDVLQVLGFEGQSLLVRLTPRGIEAVGSRADVQAIDSEFDGSPPP